MSCSTAWPAALRGLCSKAEKKKTLGQWETLVGTISNIYFAQACTQGTLSFYDCNALLLWSLTRPPGLIAKSVNGGGAGLISHKLMVVFWNSKRFRGGAV